MPQRLLACAAILPVLLTCVAMLPSGAPARPAPGTRVGAPSDTLRPGQQLRIASTRSPTVLLLRNVSPAGACVPVAYSLFSGCDSLSSSTIPEGSGSPLIITLYSRGNLAVTHVGMASASRLEVRCFAASDSVGIPLRFNVAPLTLLPYALATTRLRSAHAQLGLSALFENTRFVVIVGGSARVCSVNAPGPATPYSTPNNTLLLPLDNLQNQALAVVNASASSSAVGHVIVRDICAR
jgi:hypothetical protein